MARLNRRKFLKTCAASGVGGLLGSTAALARELSEDRSKERHAKYIFNYSSPYFTAEYETSPHVHLEIKHLVEKYTKNKVFVRIHDGGRNGIGASLGNHVKTNMSQGALLSISNFSPIIKEFDILNIPFWSARETEYLRLVSSEIWHKLVLSKTRRAKIQVLFHYVVGARTATSTRLYGKLIKSPKDFQGIRFRVPKSEILKIFYELTGAKPEVFPWKLCARTAEKGRYDALDPSVVGLYCGPEGLRKHLGVISQIESVQDGWLAIASADFIDSLDRRTRMEFLDAFQEVQVAQVKAYGRANELCAKAFANLDTRVYTPSQEEKEILARSFGHSHPAWNPVKKRLLGENGLNVFDQLYKVAKG